MIRVPLSQGKDAWIDEEDAALVAANGPWYAVKNKVLTDGSIIFYAASHDKNGARIYMHRLIMNAGPAEQVDHRNHDGLWNVRSNLRKCTRSGNGFNVRKIVERTSKYMGVCWDKTAWLAQIQLGGGTRETRKCHFIGRYPDELSAAYARDQFVRESGNQFATLNFPEKTDYSDIQRLALPASSNYPGVSRKAIAETMTARRQLKGRKEWRGRLILPTGKELSCGLWMTPEEAHRSVEDARQKWYPLLAKCVCEVCAHENAR